MENLSSFEEQLTSPNRSVRYRAVYRLSRHRDPQAMELMARVLQQDTDRDIRAISAKLLSAYSHDAVVKHLTTAMREDRYAQVRRACAEALGKLSDAAAVDDLIGALSDRSKLVRRAAVQSLRLLESAAAIPNLVGVLLGDEDSYVRWEAAKTLEALSDPAALPALIEALQADSNSYVRYAAAAALGEMADDDSIDGLTQAMLQDTNNHVRYAAARSLGWLLTDEPDPELVQAMLLGLDDEDSQVWHMIAESLWSSGEAVMPVVLATLVEDDHRLRRVALKALLWLSIEHDEDDRVSIMDDEDYTVWGWWN